MSRTPLRTALYLLMQEGYVESTRDGRQSRLSVVAPTREDARELFSLVGEIEALAAERCSALPTDARTKVVAEMRKANAAMRATASLRPSRPADTIRADAAFHDAFVEAGAGRRLLSFFRSAKPHADRCIYLYYAALTDEIIVSTEEHEQLIDAIAAGDAPAARRAVELNWRNAARRLAASMTALGDRGVW